MEPGFIVERLDAQPGSEMLVWDGERPITRTEFGERERAGEIERGPTNRAALDALPDGPPDVAQPAPASAPDVGEGGQAGRSPTGAAPAPTAVRKLLSGWEQYTREFIRKYKLDEQQSRKAWWILRRCQAQTNRYLSQRRSEIHKADWEVARLGEDPAGADAAEVVKARERLALLLKPLDDIFEQRLRPALERLPTPAQRRSVQSEADSPGRP